MLTKEELFLDYKNRILKDADHKTDYSVIAYNCKFPEIDPKTMAASIIQDGYQVVFNCFFTTKSEMSKIRSEVNNLVKTL